MNVPANLRYTKEHEWAGDRNGKCLVGITDYAQHALGDVVYVELPAVGATVTKGKSFGTVESVKAVSDIYAPVDGKVVEVNNNLSSSPELVNSSPYENAWMIVIEPTNKTQLNELLDAKQYTGFLAEISK